MTEPAEEPPRTSIAAPEFDDDLQRGAHLPCPCGQRSLWFEAMSSVDDEAVGGDSARAQIRRAARAGALPALYDAVCESCQCKVEAEPLISGKYALVRIPQRRGDTHENFDHSIHKRRRPH